MQLTPCHTGIYYKFRNSLFGIETVIFVMETLKFVMETLKFVIEKLEVDGSNAQILC